MPVKRSIVLSSMLTSAATLSLAMLIVTLAGRQLILSRTQNSLETQLASWGPALAAGLIKTDGEWQFQIDQAMDFRVRGKSGNGVIGQPQAGLWLSDDEFVAVRPLLDQAPAQAFMANSNLYAALVSAEDVVEWRSPSFGSSAIAANRGGAGNIGSLPEADILAGECELLQGVACITVAFLGSGSSESGRLFIAISDAKIAANAGSLVRGFQLALVIVSGLLVGLQSLVLYFSFRPLKRLRSEITLIKEGRQNAIESAVPFELTDLVDGFNDLIAQESERRSRLRSSLERLAHVLKTPLAVLKSKTFSTQADQTLVHQQSDRMLAIVKTELAKLSLEQPRPLVGYKSVEIEPVLQQILSAYRTLPLAHRNCAPLDFKLQVTPANLAFSGGLQDLQDIFGTLLENALRYATKSVEINVEAITESPMFCLRISDDGGGFTSNVLEAFQAREKPPSAASSGLGLSIGRRMVEHYDGQFTIANLPKGGATATVVLPREIF